MYTFIYKIKGDLKIAFRIITDFCEVEELLNLEFKENFDKNILPDVFLSKKDKMIIKHKIRNKTLGISFKLFANGDSIFKNAIFILK